jgi:hypothetical protein
MCASHRDEGWLARQQPENDDASIMEQVEAKVAQSAPATRLLALLPCEPS